MQIQTISVNFAILQFDFLITLIVKKRILQDALKIYVDMSNKKFSTSLMLLCIAFMFSLSCSDTHLINDVNKRKIIKDDFELRKKELSNGNLFAAFDSIKMTTEQREAMEFLYAYMPLCDIADHSADFFLQNVDCTLKAREEMSWGKNVPEREFLHFVLPLRTNNENLDSCRMIFYEELKSRVRGMSMYDAVLEVNHWCHEKVVYMPSDIRTSSPLATIKTAYGRCGEESTFTVAALRAIGIPARQVYTPRWAHTDSNHAWVEAWVDGKWYFFGACEPEPVLNLGWFNAPASRAMLMHTKVFGKYDGPEEVMSKNSLFTEINVIDNYAPTSRLDVNITNADGTPAVDATVEFKVYNYAEFHSVATKTTDSNGSTFLTAGNGDMLIWTSKDGKFGFSKVTFGKDKSIKIVLDKDLSSSFDLELDIIPPAEQANIPKVSDQQRADNNQLIAQEDSIRNAYVNTFYNAESAIEFVKSINFSKDTSKESATQLLVASRGNHNTISEALKTHSDKAVWILSLVSEKDLRDITPCTLADHIDNAPSQNTEFADIIANPRVSNELLTPYRSFFINALSDADKQQFSEDPQSLVKWTSDNIKIDNECNIGGAPISPKGVWDVKTADKHSRDIFFVAIARSLGIPALIDEVTGKVQIATSDGNIDIKFESEKQHVAKQGKITATYASTPLLENPKYYSHFSLSKINDAGSLELLSYEYEDSWQNLLQPGTSLDEGNYLLVSGTRLANGGVLAHLQTVAINENETTTTTLKMRQSLYDVQVIGNFNSESLFKPIDKDEPMSILAANGRGYFAVAILGVGQEPTNHALRDIATLAKDFEKWGKKMILLFPNEKDYAQFRPEEFPGLPQNIVFGIDIDNQIQKHIKTEMKLRNDQLPIFIIADTFNRVVFISQGYTIGLGEQMIKTILKL